MVARLLKRGARRARSIIAGAGRSQHKRPKFESIDGIPAGLDHGVLDETCRRYFSERLVSASHVHLSSWKSGGAFRVRVTLEGRVERSLVYKSVVYRPDDLPGLAGLAISPGPPEFTIYSELQDDLATYLPKTYFCSETAPRHYEYLIEDLGDDYERAAGHAAILTVAAELPNIRKALNRCNPAAIDHDLIQYDSGFSASLSEYAHTNLVRYLGSNRDKSTNELVRIWGDIASALNDQELHEMHSRALIHGDFGSSNILVHKQYPSRIKLIDWEWAGIGVAHADLASLLKPASAEIEECGIRIFSRQDNGLSLKDNFRLYQRCKLERALLDAAFVAAHKLETSSTTRLDLRAFIANSSERALAAHRALSG